MEHLLKEKELWIFLDIVIAATLTMFVGIEREKAHKAAGIRTNMIVGSFTCLSVALMRPLLQFGLIDNSNGMIDTDPIRVLQAIVVGVSFIGAGTIIKSREEEKITGLTTAATLLYSAGIGITVAIKYYILATCLTVFILVINRVLNYITNKFTNLKD